MRKSIKIFWAQTFSTLSLPSPIFFKTSIPGSLCIFRDFARLFHLAVYESLWSNHVGEKKREQARCLRVMNGQIWGRPITITALMISVDHNHYKDASKEVDEGCVVQLVCWGTGPRSVRADNQRLITRGQSRIGRPQHSTHHYVSQSATSPSTCWW